MAQSCRFANKDPRHTLNPPQSATDTLVDTSTTKAQVHFVDPNHPINNGARPKTILKTAETTNLKPVRVAPKVPDVSIASEEMTAAIAAATSLGSTNPFKRAGSFRYQGFTPAQNPFTSYSSLPGVPTEYNPQSLLNENYEMTPMTPSNNRTPLGSKSLVRPLHGAHAVNSNVGSIELPPPMKSFDASKFVRANTNGLPTVKTPLYRARSRDSIDPSLADLMELQLSLEQSENEEDESLL